MKERMKEVVRKAGRRREEGEGREAVQNVN